MKSLYTWAIKRVDKCESGAGNLSVTVAATFQMYCAGAVFVTFENRVTFRLKPSWVYKLIKVYL